MSSAPLTALVRDVCMPFTVARVQEGRTPVRVGKLGTDLLTEIGADVAAGRVVNVLDMPIKLPYKEVLLPALLPSWVKSVVHQALAFEVGSVTSTDPWHVYLTVHQSVLVAGTTQRTSGAHIDGMQGVNYHDPLVGCHAYTLSTAAPTVFYPHPFDLRGFDPKRDNLYRMLDEQKLPTQAWSPGPGELVAASCYCVHEAGRAVLPGPRSFVRVEFSKKRFDRRGNTRNPLIDTSAWNYRPRPISPHLR